MNQYRPDIDVVRAIAILSVLAIRVHEGPLPDGFIDVDGCPISTAPTDLLLVDGDPLAKFDLVADPRRNFVVIIKNGRVHRNTLRQ